MHKDRFDAACNAAHAAMDAQVKGKSAMGTAKVYTQLTRPKGKVYLVKDEDLEKLQTLSTGSTTAGFMGLVTDNVPATNTGNDEWEGWMAVIEEEEELEARASVNWRDHIREVDQPDPLMITPLDQDLNSTNCNQQLSILCGL